jgi:hypothetical protein
VCLIQIINAQPDVLWSSLQEGYDFITGYSAIQTSDGHLITVGNTHHDDASGLDVWLKKVNPFGELVWIKTYGGPYYDIGLSVHETADGGYIIGGQSGSHPFLIRTNIDGDTLWTRKYSGNYQGMCYEVIPVFEGGFVLTGYYSPPGDMVYDPPHVWLARVDDTGDTLWTRRFGGNYQATGFSIQEVHSWLMGYDGYIITGSTTESGSEDIWLLRIDLQGDTLWTRKYGGDGNDIGYSVRMTDDEGYIIAGRTESFGEGSGDVYLIKTDYSGHVEWQQTYGGSGLDEGSYVQQTDDSGYIIAATTRSFYPGNDNIWIIKTQEDGTLLWDKSIGTSESSDRAYVAVETHDGGFIIRGSTTQYQRLPQPWLIRLYFPLKIKDILDVENDQGGWVHVHWEASGFDIGDNFIAAYGVWELDHYSRWVSLGNVPATQDSTYLFLARTYGDSNQTGIYWSKFKITAHTPYPQHFLTSSIDSGYSVDNIFPSAPTNLLASLTDEGAVELIWNDSEDEDFGAYRVYRAAVLDDPPTPTVQMMIAETISQAYLDTSEKGGATYEYWVSAVDVNGNESDFSAPARIDLLSVSTSSVVPITFMLHPNHPNPFNPITTLRYDVPHASEVSLIVYNILGREVVRLVDEWHPAGSYRATWDGRGIAECGLPSGLYIARLVGPEYGKAIKMVLVR